MKRLFLALLAVVVLVIIFVLARHFSAGNAASITMGAGSTATSTGSSAASTAGSTASASSGGSGDTTAGAGSSTAGAGSSTAGAGSSTAGASSGGAASTAGASSGGSGDTTPLIVKLNNISPTFAKHTLQKELTKAKVAAANLLSGLGAIEASTAISPTKKAYVLNSAAANITEPSWLVNNTANTDKSSFGYYLPMLAHVLSYVMSSCQDANMWNLDGTNCAGKGFATSARKTYQVIAQINAEVIDYVNKYLGVTLVNGSFVNKTCGVGTSCGYIPDINNLIASGTVHPPNIWLVVAESKDVVNKIKKLITLLTNLVTSGAWIKQLPPGGLFIYSAPNIPLNCDSCPTAIPGPYVNNMPTGLNGVGLPAWYATFEAFMTGYISGLNTLIGDVKTTSHNLGVLTGYYNQS
jgi:hypothetical protein